MQINALINSRHCQDTEVTPPQRNGAHTHLEGPGQTTAVWKITLANAPVYSQGNRSSEQSNDLFKNTQAGWLATDLGPKLADQGSFLND